MNESIEVQFKKNGKRLRVKRQREGGIEFDEPDPLERTVGIQLMPRGDATRVRMDSVRRIQGWPPGQFSLKVSVENGSVFLRGVNEHALPEGMYEIRIQVEETHTPQRRVAEVEQDDREVISFDVTMDDRTVDVVLEDLDANIAAVLDRSSVDGATARQWLDDGTRRPTRQACLLNLLASMRTRPNMGTPLVQLVHDVFHVANDRLYAKVDRRLLTTVQTLADDPDRPFFAEGRPRASIHGLLLEAIPDSTERPRFKELLSFRSEGKPSMQIVVAVPPAGLPHTYAEFDLDLANPLQDVVGFFVHMGELLDGKPTNHLDLRKLLAKTKAADFLYYTVVNA
jgi:hypothetical protein